jgi:hypothetical protein
VSAGFAGAEPALAARSGRPGELRTVVWLELSDRVRARLPGLEGDLPPSVAVAIAVEASRWVTVLEESHGLPRQTICAALDTHAAGSASAPAIVPPVAQRLQAYCAQLREAKARPTRPQAGPSRPADGPLRVELPQRVAAAWAVCAATAGQTCAEWIDQQLSRAAGDVIAWEIAAATRGETLGEWVQAAWTRCAIAASASAHAQA